MNTRQLMSTAAFALSILAPSISMAGTAAPEGDGTSHVVDYRDATTRLSQDTVLNALKSAKNRGEFNPAAGDVTTLPVAASPSTVTRMSVINMINHSGLKQGDAS